MGSFLILSNYSGTVHLKEMAETLGVISSDEIALDSFTSTAKSLMRKKDRT